jgi:hypothetical protein
MEGLRHGKILKTFEIVQFITTALKSIAFLLLIDVNEWIHNECAECVLPHPNICDWFARSHPSKGENRTRNRSEIARVNGPLKCRVRARNVIKM